MADETMQEYPEYVPVLAKRLDDTADSLVRL